MPYHCYMGKMLLPIAPSKLQISINNQNKQLTLINEGEITILKSAKLSDIDFEVLLPQTKYPFATYKSKFRGAKYFLGKLKYLKQSKKPFQFKLVRTLPNGKLLFDTDMTVSLEEYKITEDAKYGFDIVVTISLKQYMHYQVKQCKITKPKPKANAKPKGKSDGTEKVKVTIRKERPTVESPAPKQTSKTYKVVKGDCLWLIAKKFYDDGTQYTKIFNANKDKIKNRDLIYPGQVLTIPV